MKLAELIDLLEMDPEDEVQSVYETFEWKASHVETVDHDEHRWYTIYTNIVSLNDRFFLSTSYSHKSDCQDLSDLGVSLEDLIEDIEEVFPKEKLTTIYVTVDNLGK